jgi:2-hydroxychromene-2-carboxylate isomerase
MLKLLFGCGSPWTWLTLHNVQPVASRGFGSPRIFVGDDMYFGNDRLELVKAIVLRQRMR